MVSSLDDGDRVLEIGALSLVRGEPGIKVIPALEARPIPTPRLAQVRSTTEFTPMEISLPRLSPIDVIDGDKICPNDRPLFISETCVT